MKSEYASDVPVCSYSENDICPVECLFETLLVIYIRRDNFGALFFFSQDCSPIISINLILGNYLIHKGFGALAVCLSG